MARFFVGQPLWAAGLLWLLYLALEPYVRRFWPATLVSWSRLMARQWRDPLVGRDILFGVALGVLDPRHRLGGSLLARGSATRPPPPDAVARRAARHALVLAQVGNQVFNAVLNALFVVFGMVLLKIVVRREWAAVHRGDRALHVHRVARPRRRSDRAAINLASHRADHRDHRPHRPAPRPARHGVLFLVDFIVSGAAVTLDPSRWFFADSLLLLLIPVALALLRVLRLARRRAAAGRTAPRLS